MSVAGVARARGSGRAGSTSSTRRGKYVDASKWRGASRGAVDVRCMAISRATKEAAVAKVQDIKERSAMAFAFKYETMTVQEMERFRGSLPEDATCVIMKNRLMKLSLADDDKWSAMCNQGETGIKGMNAFVFSSVESVKPTVKAYLKCAKDLKKKDTPPIITGGVMDGTFLSPKDVEQLENMPTKEELYAKIAGLIKQVPTKLGVGIKQVPSKVAYGVRAIKDKQEKDESAAA